MSLFCLPCSCRYKCNEFQSFPIDFLLQWQIYMWRDVQICPYLIPECSWRYTYFVRVIPAWIWFQWQMQLWWDGCIVIPTCYLNTVAHIDILWFFRVASSHFWGYKCRVVQSFPHLISDCSGRYICEGMYRFVPTWYLNAVGDIHILW